MIKETVAVAAIEKIIKEKSRMTYMAIKTRLKVGSAPEQKITHDHLYLLISEVLFLIGVLALTIHSKLKKSFCSF